MQSRILKQLGFHRILNAAGHYTVIGGSCPSKEVLQAIEEAAGYWVDMNELQAQAGKLLSGYIGCEDGIITSGAYASNTIATEVALARAREKGGPVKNPNVVIQKSHTSKYAQSFRTSGVELREIERKSSNEDLCDYVDNSTIALTYVLKESLAEFDLRETVEAGMKAELPIIVDASLVDPPIRGIKHILTRNPDMISISGGKGFGGPNASGLLIGKTEFIAHARGLSFPNYGPGRAMKVSKEQIAGIMAAVKCATEADEERKIAQWQEKVESVRRMVLDLPGVRTEISFPWHLNFPQPVPRLYIHIERADGVELAQEIRSNLMQDNPPVFTKPLDQIVGPKNKIVIDARLLSRSEVQVVGERLRMHLRNRLAR